MKKIAFIGRKQGLRKWEFAKQGLENGRLQEEDALKASGLIVVDDPSTADLVQIRLRPEKTSNFILKKIRKILDKLPTTTRVFNDPTYFPLYAEKHLAYREWQKAGLVSIPHQLWSFWNPVKEQINKIREFTDDGSAYFRTHNEDGGKGLFYLQGNETDDELRRIINHLRWRSLTNRVSGSKALITREIKQHSDISRIFRVHMVKGKPIGGYALTSNKKIIHAADVEKKDLNHFIEANQQLLQWMKDENWIAQWRQATQTLGLDFTALEFFCVDNRPVLLEANPMWGGRHKFGSIEFTQWLKSDNARYLHQEIPNIFNWLDAYKFYQSYWHELAIH